jgi:hypothetical protein
MARDPKRLRKAYEFKIGKDRADKLSDEQINLLSKYYNSLSESEQRDIDAKVFQGRSNELFEMADAFASESQGHHQNLVEHLQYMMEKQGQI